MNMAARFFAVLIFAFAARSIDAAPLKVVTSNATLADFVRQVGGKNVDVFSISSGRENLHNVLMKPSMVVRLARADLYIQQGLGLEHSYGPALLQEARNAQLRPGRPGFLDTSRGIPVRDVPRDVSRREGDVHPMGNPHYDLDPVLAKKMVAAIADRLGDLDRQHRNLYRANANAYISKLDAKIREWSSKIRGKNTKFVSYHPDFTYFAARFGLEQVGTIQPKPGIEPGPRHIQELIERMKSQNVTLIVKESFFSDRVPRVIAKETGARLVTVPISVNGMPGADDYISMMDRIVGAFAGGGEG
jgi:zinc/manganese transport system substrate-binding protein